MAGVLPMDDETQARARDLARRAALPANWYRPGEAAVPGDSPTFTEVVGSYRVVFTWTVFDPDPGSAYHTFRHLSVSNLSQHALPAPEVVCTLAHWLGFSGATPGAHGAVLFEKRGKRWRFEVDRQDNCVVVVEPTNPDVAMPPLPARFSA